MKKAIIIVLSLAFIASVSFAFAEELAVKPEGIATAIREKKAEMAQAKDQWKLERQAALDQLKQQKEEYRATRKQQLSEEKCTRIEEKIQSRTSQLGTAKVKHMSVYTNLRNRIQKFIDRFDAFYTANPDNGDTSKLTQLKNDFGYSVSDAVVATTTIVDTTAPVTLKSLIVAFQTSLTEFSAKLGTTKKNTCQSSEGELLSSLVDTREYLKSVHDNAAAIRTFVRGTILPDLLAVKKDIAKARGGTGESGEEATEVEDEDETDGDETNETTDTTLPVVSIASPVDGLSYTIADTVVISASATDNDKVEKVEFLEGGVVKGTDEEAPYSYNWVITSASENRTYSWTARAYDDAEPANTAISTAINLTVNMLSTTPELTSTPTP